MLKVVVLGHGEMLANLIAGALDANCKIVGVLRYEKTKGKFLNNWLQDFVFPSVDYNYIKSYNLYQIKAKSANSEAFKKEILKLNPDVILVGTWCEKLKKEIIRLPKIAFINTHPSLLPKYRGPNPYLEVIRNLETQSGVTFHLMDENYDTGAILHQKKVSIEKFDTGKELKQKIVFKAREGVRELLSNLGEDLIIPLIQSETSATYFKNIKECEVMINFEKTAEEISAQIRAFHPWYKCFFEYKNQFFVPNPYRIQILKCEKEHLNLKEGTIVYKNAKNAEVHVLCKDKKLLKLANVKLYGRIKQLFTKFYIDRFVKL